MEIRHVDKHDGPVFGGGGVGCSAAGQWYGSPGEFVMHWLLCSAQGAVAWIVAAPVSDAVLLALINKWEKWSCFAARSLSPGRGA